MTPERKGAEPRQEATSSLRFDKETAEPKTKSRPDGAWKKTAARMSKEGATAPDTPEQGPKAAYDPIQPGAPSMEEVPPQAGADTEPEATAPGEGARQSDSGAVTDAGASGQNVPKFRQHSKREDTSGQSIPNEKFRQDSKQARPADRLHHDGDSAGGGSGPTTDRPEPDKLRKTRQRMEYREAKLNTAKGKLEQQKPYKPPGPVKQAAGFAGRSVHSFVHGKIYQEEHDNVGVEGAHRTELVGEAAGRKAVRFTKERIRTHPARAVQKAEGQYVKAVADHHFQQAAAEHPDLGKNALARMWQKRQQRKRYQKQAKEAAKQGAKAAEKTAVTAEKAGRAVVSFVKRHPAGVVVALLCLLILVGMQSCMSSLGAVGNGVAGGVAATTYPAEDADLLGAEAAYCGLEAELQDYLDNYEATHDYDEYHFDLDDIEHDPYVLLSILSALHEGAWTLNDVQGTLQALFDRQYILTENVVVEVRYRTETRTDSEGNTYSVSVPYNYYICTVTLENFDLSHLPVYIMGTD